MAVGTALALASLIPTLFAGAKSREMNNNNQRELDRRRAELDKWLAEADQDYLNTEAGQSALTQLRNSYQEAVQKANAGGTIQGASDEKRVATNEAIANPYFDSITKLAGYGTQYRDSVRREGVMRDETLSNMQMGINNNRSQTAMNLASTAANFGASAMTADAMGAFEGGAVDTWLGSLFKKK